MKRKPRSVVAIQEIKHKRAVRVYAKFPDEPKLWRYLGRTGDNQQPISINKRGIAYAILDKEMQEILEYSEKVGYEVKPIFYTEEDL